MSLPYSLITPIIDGDPVSGAVANRPHNEIHANVLDLDGRMGTHISAAAPHSGHAPTTHSHPDATPSASGFMSALDKAKIDALSTRSKNGALLYTSGMGQVIPSHTPTAVLFQAEVYDTASFHTGTSSLINIPTGVRWVRLRAQIGIEAVGADAWVEVEIRKNKNMAIPGLPNGSARGINSSETIRNYISLVSGIIDVVAGDYFEVYVYHTAGSARLLASAGPTVPPNWFEIEVLG